MDPLIQVIIVLIVAGAALAVLPALGLDAAMTRIIRIVVIAAVVIWLLVKFAPMLSLS